MWSPPDPRPPRRVRDPDLLRDLHVRWRGACALMDDTCVEHRYSLHHVHKHPRDDVEANLVMLCGDGTTGHHGRIEAHDHAACQALGVHLIEERLDTLEYLGEKLGGLLPVAEWFRTQLRAP